MIPRVTDEQIEFIRQLQQRRDSDAHQFAGLYEVEKMPEMRRTADAMIRLLLSPVEHCWLDDHFTPIATLLASRCYDIRDYESDASVVEEVIGISAMCKKLLFIERSIAEKCEFEDPPGHRGYEYPIGHIEHFEFAVGGTPSVEDWREIGLPVPKIESHAPA